MKIWRKENTRPIKEDKTQKDEEFTDISAASTPKEEPKKDKMEEIYSTKDKQIKYKRLTPLEAEQAAKLREKLALGEAELAPQDTAEEEKIVELTSEFEEGTVIAEDIIEDVDNLHSKHPVEIQDIDEIDIPIDPTSAVKKYERQANSTSRHDERLKQKPKNAYEQIFGKPKFYVGSERVIAKIPTYQHENKVNRIHLKAGRFTDIVSSEYDEYLKSKAVVASRKEEEKHEEQRPSLLFTLSQLANQKNAEKKAAEQVQAAPVQVKPKKKKGPLHKASRKVKKFLKIAYKMVVPNSNKKPLKADTEQKPKTVDYQSRQDLKFVEKEISKNFRKLFLRASLGLVIFVLALTLTIMEKSAGLMMFSGIALTPLIYCSVNLLILVLIGVLSKSFIVSGLKPLKHFKGNSDTALSVAYVACMLQQIVSIFMPGAFVASDFHLYTAILSLCISIHTVGRLTMVYRVKENFRFIAAKSPAYAARIYNDEDTARKMLSGTTASHSVIAYQHKTEFLSDFLKISYAPDPSEELSGKLSPITLVSSVFVAIVYGFLFKSFLGALCALAVMCCISIPISALLAGNIPLLLCSKNSLKHGAMLSGYPSIRQFDDCNAIMVNAKELYPKGCIKINKIKYFAEYRIEDAMLSAATIMKTANSPLRYAFSDMLKENAHNLPKVESVMYEDKLGLVGWVNGERVLIGNRKLLDRFHIYIEDAADELNYKNHNKEVTYIACSGQLIALVVSTYSPDKKVKDELTRAQKNGLCLIVSTTDSNITADKIALDYEIFPRTVKVLNTGFATTCNEVCSKKEESTRAYLATRGSISSLIHAITNAISFKQNLTIGLIVQIFGLILGVLLTATLVLYASVSILGVIEILLYMIFWGIAAVVSQLLNKP
ncbi:MAG: hypothetical protein IJO20_08815 [Ruminococcus sp.]|nr:hypothetical protein [Ruminococcus sp.]